MVGKDGERYTLLSETQIPQTIGRLSGNLGNAGILLRAYIYMRMLGREGMRRVADYSTLLDAIAASVPLSSDAVVALEHRSGGRAEIPDASGRLQYRRTSRYGNVSISFFDLSEPNEHE